MNPANPSPVQHVQEWMTSRGLVIPEVAITESIHPGPPAAGPDHSGSRTLSADRNANPPDPLSRDVTRGPAAEAIEECPDQERLDAFADRSRPDGQRGDRHDRNTTGSTGVAAMGVGAEIEADPEAVARQIVLRKLSAQARTRSELAKALRAKLVPEEVARTVLDRMEDLRLVNDAEFAHDWVDSRQERRHLSKGALRRELQAKGVVTDHIEAALAEVGAADELSAARALAEKKVRSMAGLDPRVRYRRLAGVLGRRGFGSGVINQVLSEVADSP